MRSGTRRVWASPRCTCLCTSTWPLRKWRQSCENRPARTLQGRIARENSVGLDTRANQRFAADADPSVLRRVGRRCGRRGWRAAGHRSGAGGAAGAPAGACTRLRRGAGSGSTARSTAASSPPCCAAPCARRTRSPRTPPSTSRRRSSVCVSAQPPVRRRRRPDPGVCQARLIVNVRARRRPPAPGPGTGPSRSSSASVWPMRARIGSSHARSALRPSVPSICDAITPARAATSAALGRNRASRARHDRISAHTGSDRPRSSAAASRALPLSSDVHGPCAPPPSSASSVAPSA